MWILKIQNSYYKAKNHHIFPQIYSIKTFDFTTLYTTTPHDKLKITLFSITDTCFYLQKW
jgi:hypothetical protein